MATPVQADRVHVLQRLRDLRDWAHFIHDSATMDQPYETGKQDLLLAYLGEEFLREFANDSASLARRLEMMIEKIEASAAPAGKTATSSR
jgi:N12 class adenine-specific DNA methylase